MADIALFILKRDRYVKLTTLGTLTCPDGQVFQTLEDCVRGWAIKDAGNTAIPQNEKFAPYEMDVTMSQRFGREMVIIHTGDKVNLEFAGIKFAGIRIHGGNTDKDVRGCIAVARKRTSDTSIQGSVESVITEMVKNLKKQGFDCRLRVINKPQAQ